MKLYYYKQPNFGDALNPWLWQKLIPELIDTDDSVVFVAIGTLMNQKLLTRTLNAHKKVIFGTGVGYGKPPTLDDSFKIYCVRGPLSAEKLGISTTYAITDGAFLIRNFLSPNSSSAKVYPYTYMPHYELAGEGWQIVCRNLGWGYIDPRWSVDKALDILQKTEVLLAEAMHGAIVADALRIPWIPIVSNSSIFSFKWQDWCQSINVQYQPFQINRLHHPKRQLSWASPFKLVRDWTRQQAAAKALKKAAQTASPCLSSDSMAKSLTNRLQEQLEQLKQDYAKLIKTE